VGCLSFLGFGIEAPVFALPTVLELHNPHTAADLVSQTPPPEGIDEGELLPPVTVTSTRSPERLFDIAPATTVINRSQALERTQTDLADLFRGEVGVFVRATNPSAGSPVIRGVTGRDVLLLVDGFRLSHAFARPNVQYQGFVDPYFLNQVEIVRGPVSTLYGSDALGGATNVITPTFQEDQPRFRLHTDYNSNPSGSSTYLQGSFGDKQFSTIVGLTYRSFGDITIGSNWDPKVNFPNIGTTIGRSGYEYFSGNLKTQVSLAENQTFSLTAQYSRIPTVARQDGMIQGYGSNVASAELGFSPQGRLFVLGDYKITFKNTWLDELRFQLGYQQVQDDRFQRNFSTRPSFPNYGSGGASPNTSLESNISNLIGVTTVAKSTWGNNHFTYGVESYFDKVNAARSIRNEVTGTTPDPNGSRYVDGSTFNQYGVFVQDEIRWTPQFNTTVGIRYSAIDVNVPFSAVRPGTSGFKASFNAVTANASFLYRFIPEAELVFNIGQGFRAPNINDLAAVGERRASDINIPNPSLNPEKVFSVDGGFKWNAANFSGEFYGFWSNYSDRINSVSIGQQVNADGSISQLLQTRNVAKLTIWGVELGARYRFAPELSAFFTGNFTYGEFPIFNETSIPPFNGVIGVRY
jgi:outer membrane receptor protein involved in Fe transport